MPHASLLRSLGAVALASSIAAAPARADVVRLYCTYGDGSGAFSFEIDLARRYIYNAEANVSATDIVATDPSLVFDLPASKGEMQRWTINRETGKGSMSFLYYGRPSGSFAMTCSVPKHEKLF